MLAALPMQVRLDALTRVKKAIDDMIVQLTAEKNDELKLKDFCIDACNQNQVQTENNELPRNFVDMMKVYQATGGGGEMPGGIPKKR